MNVCCFVLCIITLLGLASSFDKAKKLHEDILRKSGYNKVIRPVINASDHIDVNLGLKLSQLIDVVSSRSWNCVAKLRPPKDDTSFSHFSLNYCQRIKSYKITE